MQLNRFDAALLWDMMQAAQRIEEFTRGLDRTAYVHDVKTQSSVERQLLIIGEAAGNVSAVFRQAHPEIDWRRMIGQRNVIVHDYGRIDQERIWAVLIQHIPKLIVILKDLLPPLPGQE